MVRGLLGETVGRAPHDNAVDEKRAELLRKTLRERDIRCIQPALGEVIVRRHHDSIVGEANPVLAVASRRRFLDPADRPLRFPTNASVVRRSCYDIEIATQDDLRSDGNHISRGKA